MKEKWKRFFGEKNGYAGLFPDVRTEDGMVRFPGTEQTAVFLRLIPTNVSVMNEAVMREKIRCLKNVLEGSGTVSFLACDLHAAVRPLSDYLEEKWKSEKNEKVRRLLASDLRVHGNRKSGQSRGCFLMLHVPSPEAARQRGWLEQRAKAEGFEVQTVEEEMLDTLLWSFFRDEPRGARPGEIFLRQENGDE